MDTIVTQPLNEANVDTNTAENKQDYNHNYWTCEATML